MDIETRTVLGQPAWIVENRHIELAITQLGGMMAPVAFARDSQKPIQPYYVSPWQGTDLVPEEPVLVPLRGDFFCLPFGAAGSHRGIDYVTHGEPATAGWDYPDLEESGGLTTFSARMLTSRPKGQVTKTVQLREGHPAIYTTHSMRDYTIRTSIGHHATLAADPAAPLAISTSPLQFGMTAPGPEEPYVGGEYSALLPGAEFQRLDSVPTRWKTDPMTDCSTFPNRNGFVDILSVFQERPEPQLPTWVAAVNAQAGYLWFSLKDPAVLPATVFWMENHGRHQSPWNGHNCCIGLEDVCGYFADGLAESAQENELSKRGISTSIELTPDDPTAVRYIQGAVTVPEGFNRVADAEFGPDQVTFTSVSGASISVPVRWRFLFDGEL